MSQTKTQLVEGLNINTSAPADALAIDNSGRVGVGTSSPNTGSKLHVVGDILITGTNARFNAGIDGSASNPTFVVNDGDTGMYRAGANALGFTTGGTAAVIIDSSQRVGIGTTSVDRPLHISTAGNESTIRLESTIGTVTAGTQFGNIEFEGNDTSTGSAGVLAAIRGIAPRTQDGSNANGGALSFHTSTVNPLTLSEQMRVECEGDLQFNSGYGSVATAYGVRAWVNFNGTGTVAIRASGNVSSITDVSTGVYQANFTTNMPDDGYAAVCTKRNEASNSGADVNLPDNRTFRLEMQLYEGGTVTDSAIVSLVVIR